MGERVLLMGTPVSESLSPRMQNAAFRALGIPWTYVTEEVGDSDLAAAITNLRADPSAAGANITIPLKESVLPLLDELDPIATRIGAVNTISRAGRELKGWNTDVEGFSRALAERGYVFRDRKVAIIGAGGAARAVAAALEGQVASLSIVARNLEQARRLCRDLELTRTVARGFDELPETVAAADLVVNATPVDVGVELMLRRDQEVFDLSTRRSIEGKVMLLHQGAAAFEIWTGKSAPVEVMREVLGLSAPVTLT
jgi:shikimate dehydrogenase